MLRKYRPITPSQRQLVLPMNELLSRVKPGSKAKPKPHKPLLLPKKGTGGRNNLGRITCRHRGGCHKRKLRVIDFHRDKMGIPAKVATIEYDPNRSSYIALLHYVDGEKRYIIAPQGIKVGDTVQTSEGAPFNIGCCMRLKEMPLGSVVHNIEMRPGKGGQLVRSAGLSAQLMARANGYATMRMPSGEVRMINESCFATLGVVSNPEHNLRVEGKAGRMRWKGIRPTVRGIAMNPVDHPMGGGEGRGKGNIPQTPWAVPTKGHRTRKTTNRYLVKDRRK